jgi:hypothetical protein
MHKPDRYWVTCENNMSCVRDNETGAIVYTVSWYGLLSPNQCNTYAQIEADRRNSLNRVFGESFGIHA